MKCPKCHAEVKDGSLYCDKCLAEIPWVKEFNSVETLMEKKKLEEPKQSFSFIKKEPAVRFPKLLVSRRKGVLLCALILVLGILMFRQLHTFSALYHRAEQAYQSGEYENALSLAEQALDKKPEHLRVNLLRAKILEAEGDFSSAILVMQPVIKKFPDSAPVYQMLLRLLSHENRTREIKKLLSECESPEVLEVCREYIAEPPNASLLSGTYTTEQTVELTAEGETIYYTMDGKNPTEKSLVYSGPIPLMEGSTTLKAMAVNALGIPSDVVSWDYILVYGVPAPPKIYPEDGNYYKKTEIELEVPDGCIAYYAFDEIPTVNSTQYQNPISMPEGYHDFYAILEAANGEVSETAHREYYLEY